MGQLDNCSRFKSKAKRSVIWATVLVIAVALMLWLCGCNAPITLYPLDEAFTAPRDGKFFGGAKKTAYVAIRCQDGFDLVAA